MAPPTNDQKKTKGALKQTHLFIYMYIITRIHLVFHATGTENTKLCDLAKVHLFLFTARDAQRRSG